MSQFLWTYCCCDKCWISDRCPHSSCCLVTPGKWSRWCSSVHPGLPWWWSTTEEDYGSFHRQTVTEMKMSCSNCQLCPVFWPACMYKAAGAQAESPAAEQAICQQWWKQLFSDRMFNNCTTLACRLEQQQRAWGRPMSSDSHAHIQQTSLGLIGCWTWCGKACLKEQTCY